MSEASVAPPRRRVLRNIFFSVLTKTSGVIFTYLTTRLLVETLEVQEYGLYSLLFMGVLLGDGFALILRWGIPDVMYRFLPEYFSRGEFQIIARLQRAAMLIMAATATTAAIITYFLADTIAQAVNYPGSGDLLRVFSVGALAFLMAENYRILLASLFQQQAIFAVVTVYNIIRLAAIYYVFQYHRSLDAVVWAESALLVVHWILFAGAYRFRVFPKLHPAGVVQAAPSAVPWQRFRRYGVLQWLNEIGVTVLGAATDILLVTGLLGGVQAGFYGLANRIQQIVRGVLPHKMFDAMIEPMFFSEYGAARERSEFGYNLLLKVSMFISIPTALWLAMMARPVIVELFDPRYGEAAPILAVTALFFPMLAMRTPMSLVIQNAERSDLLLYSKITGVIKILLGLWLVPRGGVMAMVWISGCAMTAQNIMLFYWMSAKLSTRTDLLGIAKQTLCALITAAIFWLVRSSFTGVLGIFAGVMTFGTIYLALCLVIRSFTEEERNLINSKLKRNLWRF